MADPPQIQFGRRRPNRLPDAPPSPAPKRSHHVALLVMGTMAVGGAAFAMTVDSAICGPPPPAPPGVAAPAQPQGSCTSRVSSSSGSSYGRTRYSFFGGDSTSRASTSGVAESGSVSRGGFGGLGRAFGFSGG
jgi:hypothetical protein